MTDNQHENTNEQNKNDERIPLRDDTGGDWSKANKRYFDAVNQNRDIQDRLDRLEQTFSERVNPAERAAERRTALERIEAEYALPAEMLRQAIREVAGVEYDERMMPLAEGMAARNKAVEKWGKEYVENEADMLTWAASNPEVKDTYNALLSARKPQAAYDYAFSMFRVAKASQSPQAPTEEDVARRNAANVPRGGAGPGRNAATDGSREKDFNDALGYYRETRDMRPVAKELWRGQPLTWAEHMRAFMQEDK